MNRWIRLLTIITLLSMLSLACKVGLPQKAKEIADDVSSTLRAESNGDENGVESTPTRQPKASLVPTEAPEPTVTEEAESVEIRQWASSAKASSEYGSSDWSASQAVGEPDTPDDCQDYTSAWASYDPNGVDWLEVYYDTPVVPTEITIVMTYNPSQVTDIEVIDANGERHLILEDEPAQYDCPDYMTITVEDVNFTIQGVRISLDQSILGLGWTEIDAVELVGMTAGGSAQPADNE